MAEALRLFLRAVAAATAVVGLLSGLISLAASLPGDSIADAVGNGLYGAGVAILGVWGLTLAIVFLRLIIGAWRNGEWSAPGYLLVAAALWIGLPGVVGLAVARAADAQPRVLFQLIGVAFVLSAAAWASAAVRRRIRAHNASRRACPACAETISQAANVCRYCGLTLRDPALVYLRKHRRGSTEEFWAAIAHDHQNVPAVLRDLLDGNVSTVCELRVAADALAWARTHPSWAEHPAPLLIAGNVVAGTAGGDPRGDATEFAYVEARGTSGADSRDQRRHGPAVRPSGPEAILRRRIGSGLDADFAGAEERELALNEAKVVVFADHYKGAGDERDGFARSEEAYNDALQHYFTLGYTLCVLGDCEDLWRWKPRDVLARYERTLALEGAFHAEDRYERFWGERDDLWRWPRQVESHLGTRFPGLRARSALKLQLKSGTAPLGVLFLAHGHQGTLDSDRFSSFSRAMVRDVWRPLQRRFDVGASTPANDWLLRAHHDEAMFAWARAHSENLVLIAAHTHRPVFAGVPQATSRAGAAAIAAELAAKEAQGASAEWLSALSRALEAARSVDAGAVKPARLTVAPCYFNPGSCLSDDGDVSGLEIVDSHIRLIRWRAGDGSTVLASTPLDGVMTKLPRTAWAPQPDEDRN